MQAITYERYGSPDVLKLREIEKPAVTPGMVLVRVRASSVNAADLYFMRGEPYIFRLVSGLTRPKKQVLGFDLAGVVEAVGRGVTRFQPGDEVYGEIECACFAEYVRAAENALGRKPANLTFEQAAVVPLAAHTALLGLRDKARVQPGQQVLINGASGGVGTFAVQIAKAYGAVVTGVCSSRNVELVRSLGADHVVDYTREDFTQSSRRYDVVFDNVGNHSLWRLRRVIKPGGLYLTNGGPKGRWLGPAGHLARVMVVSMLTKQKTLTWVEAPNAEDLQTLKDMLEAGTIKPVIDRTYPLSEVPEAIRYFEDIHPQGKVAITVCTT